MNYFEWSQEYYNTAADIAIVIEKLKNERKGKAPFDLKELNMKIAKYRTYYNECLDIANHLLARHKGVA